MAQRKMMFAYIGKTYGGTEYYQNNYEFLCTNFPDVTDIIICHSNNYNQVGAQSTSGYDTIINGGNANVNLVACTNVMKKYNMPFYVALPSVNVNSKLGTGSYSDEYENWKTYLSKVRTALTNNGSWGLCKGFYLSNEIIPGTINQNNIMGHTFAKLLNDIAYVIRSDPNSQYYREFIWVPYLGYNINFIGINNNNGILANKTNIFDMVVFQPHYYYMGDTGEFNPSTNEGTPPENKELAAKCALDNKVYNFASKTNRTSYVVVAGSKTASTKIGVEIEVDHRAVTYPQTKFCNLYREQCEAIGSVVGTDAPIVFYCGSGDTQIDAKNTVNQFFENGTSYI